jgi:acyl-CoA hydrolase
MAKDLGRHGNLFGGNMMAWADEAAAIFAIKTANYELMVTRKIGEINFTKPVKEGTMLHFNAWNVKRGTSSISFNLTVTGNERIEGNFVEYFTTDFVFVAIDEQGKRCDLPSI